MSDEERDQLERDEARRSVPPPGPMVRRAREQRQMSVEELSRRTRLGEAVVRAVEADQFGSLGQPVYARGYYRKCAQVLGLNGELLVDAYEKHSGTASPVPEIRQRPSISYREGPGPLAITLACLALASLLGGGGWWLLLKPERGAHAQVDAGEPAAPRARQPAPQAPAEAAAPAPATPAPAVQTASLPAASPVPLATPQPVAATPVPEEQPIMAEEPAAKPYLLSLSLARGDSWIEVSDSRDERLVYKLHQRGDLIEVDGVPPYDVYLGRGDVVDLWLGGRRIDFSAQIGEDLRTRFRVGRPRSAQQ